MLDGETVFKLYDTFGFPVDLTADICRERGVAVDLAGFEAAMEQQRERARAACKFTHDGGRRVRRRKTEFRGYDTLGRRRARWSRCTARARRSSALERRRERRRGARPHAVLRRVRRPGRRPRRARSAASRRHAFAVEDTQKIQADVFGHHGTLKTGELAVGDTVAGARSTRHARERTHAQPLGDAPDARGAARGARHARAAEGLAGRRRTRRASTSRTTSR